MNTRMVIALATLALGVAACGSGTEPEREFGLSFNLVPADTIMEGDTVVFTREDYHAISRMRPLTVATEPGGTFRVLGSFVTGCSGPLPEASAERSPTGVILTISFPPKRKFTCLEMPRPYTYEARFTQVERGTYALTIEHIGDYIREDGVVLEQQVEVR